MIRFLFRLVALALLLYALGYAVFAVLLPRPAGDERTEAVVVLTGGSGRLERGFDLVQRGVAPHMLISGVDRTVRPVELAAAYDVDPQLIECCVSLGRESFDTRSNADEVARWVERRNVRSIRLVTNDLHMPRAYYELRKRMGNDFDILVDAVPTEPSFGAIYLEYNKYLLGRAADLIGI
ncbi:YdcF family protein [Sphingosinicella terrae]|uniref:YdcF family protein n=1 Tax=Sphingosinicella terrae TaxID=2172047 RepID=UPI002547BDEC|nr:YdcF family protein [Sphingosinicella terrae]